MIDSGPSGSSRRKLAAGDLIEVTVPEGFAYLQHVAYHPRLGRQSIVRVLDGIQSSRSTDLARLAREPEQFVTALSVEGLILDGLLRPVGHAPVPSPWSDQPLPLFKRTTRNQTGVLQRRIVNIETRESWAVESYDEVQARYPETGVIGLPILVAQISSGWRSEMADFGLIGIAEPVTKLADGLHGREHYLYLPSQAAGEAAQEKLASLGLAASLRPGSDTEPWLLLLRDHQVVHGNQAAIERAIQQAADDLGGSYDGDGWF